MTHTLAQQAANIPNTRARIEFIKTAGGHVDGRWFGGHRIVFPDDSIMVIRGGSVESPLPTFVPKMPTD